MAFATSLGLAKGGAVKCSPDDPGLPLLLAELQKHGWTGKYGFVPLAERATHFPVQTIVRYDEEDINGAELLCLGARWAEWPITSLVRRNGRRWVGIAGERVGEDTGQGWDQTHGGVDGFHNYFVHPKVRAHFEKAGLRLLYHPLEWDEPELAQGEFWEIDTAQVMPPCLNPIASDEVGMQFYEDAGCQPVELRFRHGEVAAMGDFDVAWTCEEVGKPGDPRNGGHCLVVSQRFRRACRDYGLTHVSFVPVRLVDEI